MNYYFITGSSKGIGKALTELLLQDSTNFIYGFARTCSIEHENYLHKTIDFNELDEVEKYSFPELIDPKKIVLINNAGIVGDIKHVGEIDNKQLRACYNINLIAPSILINSFVQTYSHNKAEKLIINISSGAGRIPIDGWNVYCSSKAGIDMFSQVLNEEVKIDNSNISVLSLAPGIIDTEMQNQIRKSEQSAFSNINRFIEYKRQGELASPEYTAQQIVRFIQEKDLSTNVICSVRDLTN